MPLTPAATAAITAGGAIVQQGLSNAQTNARNERQFYYQQMNNQMQYQRDIDFWNMQNSYNAPESQMKRLKDAGLNPHLVYGNGAKTEAGPIHASQMQAPDIRTPDTANWQGAIQGGLSAYYDASLKEAQTNNLNAQHDVIMEEMLLKQAQTAGKMIDNARSQFDLDFLKEIRHDSLSLMKEKLNKIRLDQELKVSANERAMAMLSQNLKESAMRILRMREQNATSVLQRQQIQGQIKKLENDVTLQSLDMRLKKQGIGPTDDIYWRVLGTMIATGKRDPLTPLEIGATRASVQLGKDVKDYINLPKAIGKKMFRLK